MAQAKAEVQKLKESESNLKQKLEDKASGSKLKEIQKLHEKFEKIPGIPTSIGEANPESYADSPFVDEIAKVDIPKKFVAPSMRTYDGTADPQNHVTYYKQRMLAASIPSDLRQVCMCKGFGTNLTGPALQWYINLPNGRIKSFADLVNSFNHQYDVGTSVEAFRQGLPLDSDFYDELTMKPCQTFEDVPAKALGYIRLEEDKSFKAETTNSVSGYERSSRKSSNHRGSSSRPSSYARPDRLEVNYAHQGLIKRLDNMGDLVKWPKNTENPNSKKDTTRWCEFQIDIGHTTEECLGLRRQVAYLLKKGYLKDLMPSKNRDDNRSRKD
ncbi:uncharacterized protein LOC141629492 [Silene latifolia]|uniref:uncharacterized protein LOC141629492 n=1 Tax=Silene latifolia TaxID=37657 RepID=UPI003D778E72